MNVPSWLTSVRHLFKRHHGICVHRQRRRARQNASHQAERLEERRLLAFDLVAAFVQPSQPFYVASLDAGEIASLDTAPQQITLRFSPGVDIDSESLGSISVTRSGRGGDPFEPSSGSVFTDVNVAIGSITVNDVPNKNEVVIRFAESLPDDTYRIDVGAGLEALSGDAVRPTSFDIRLNLGAHVVSVVPQPVIRAKTIEFRAVPADGDLLTVSIRGKPLVMEFDNGTGPAVAAGRVEIVTTGRTPQQIAEAVRNAINNTTNFDGERGAPATVAAAVGGNGPTLTVHGATFTPVVSATRGTAALAASVITVGDGALSQRRDAVVVHFNANDPLNLNSAQNPQNYQLFTTDRVTGAATSVITPLSVSYDAASGSAVLTFAARAVADGQLYRLQVGNSADVNNMLATATDIGTIFRQPGVAPGAPAFTTTARIGDAVVAGVHDANDVDLYKVRLTATGTITFTATPLPGSGLDVRVRLLDSNGLELVSTNAAGANAAETLVSNRVAGEYFIEVTSFNGASGSYTVAVLSDVAVPASDENSSYSTATSLGSLGAGGSRVSASIARRTDVPTPAGNLPFPSQPGSIDEVGHRDVPVNRNSEQHGDIQAGSGPAQAITVQEYNFRSVYGLDPQGNQLINAITETQKQRAREIFDLYSQYTGIRFIETAAQGIAIITGDMRAISPTINTAPLGLAGPTNLGFPAAIMDSTDDWGVSEYGGSWFRVAMHEIGHVLGLEHSYDIPSIMGNGLTGEAVFPGDYDLIHMEMLYPKTGSDIDIYSFTLAADGRLTAETIVARPGTAVTSYLDTVLTLYREVTVNGATTREMVSRNDDYFGRDSFIGLDLAAADAQGNAFTYYVAVTSTGNTDFNPTIENSGYGGRTQGDYELRLSFDAVAVTAETIVDASQNPVHLDGDRDGVAGGSFDFWFNTASAADTIFVDKAAAIRAASIVSGSTTVTGIDVRNLATGMLVKGTGIRANTTIVALDVVNNSITLSQTALITSANAAMTFSNGSEAFPYVEIDDAVAAVSASTRIIRIVGNDGNAASLTDDRAYLIGRAQGQTGTVLSDGATFNVPRGVTAIIDEGAVLKLRGAVIDVGSASTQPSESRAGASLQVLGTPHRQVRFTSYHDDQWGGNSDGTGPAAAGGQWGGIVLRQDSDVASKLSFVNAITNAEFRYGGGQVSVNSQLRSFTPIQLESTRPTIAFNRITQSAGAAISADPNSFDDSNGRIGPELRGNLLTGNSINGVFIRVTTSPGSAIAKLTVPARFKSTDIVYVVAENLVIDGGAGGYLESGAGDIARATGRLTIDPGVVVKLAGSRVELERGGSRLYAEGLPDNRVIFTSLADSRFGAGGTFDTNGNQPDTPVAGDWAGIVLNAGAAASFDSAYIGFGGGTSPIEGRVASFNVLETHQGELRLANSRVENNGAGYSAADGVRTGRGTNAAATIFVRGAQPVIVGNDFRDNRGSIVSINANALNDRLLGDYGRSTGEVGRTPRFDNNFGPLVRGNTFSYTIDAAAGRPAGGAVGGMEVRAEEITVEAVWDDTDIVHVLRDEIVVNNFHTATGLQLRSSPDASLVVKLLGANAGLTAAGYGLQIDDRIGGTVQVLGQPGYPVVFTSLHDDTIYASLNPLGIPVRDTGNDGTANRSSAGDWRGLRFLSMSNDRNVATVAERELSNTGGLAALQINGDVDSAQVLGVLGPNFAILNKQGTLNSLESAQEKGGDDVRRLGFEVNGTIASDDPTDVDVYSFEGYAGSEVWIDIDKTSPSLDAMVELLDANGTLLARSADALNDIGVVRSNAPDVRSENSGGGQQRVFDLAHRNILPGTLAGVIYEDNTAIQTFTVARDGTFKFTRIGNPVSEAVAATSSLNRDTGVISLGFDVAPIGTIRIEATYEFSRLPLATLGFTGAGDPLGEGEHGAYSLTKDQWRGNDTYSTNPRDPGMRVILPGVVGNLSRYFIRVRSQPAHRTPANYATDLETTNAGSTSGHYQLRVRLRQQDEKPGSTVSYADIRYPVVGVDVVGLPRNSQLVGENGEEQTDTNDAFSGAQQLGNLLATDRNTISVAGEMANAGDVDWYSFTLDYTDIQSIGGVNNFGKTWATMFDIDYADGFRGDLTLSVFDAQGRLIYVGRDSDIADDQPGAGQGDDFDDLSRGSLGKLDPFIGSVHMPAGGPGSSTRYYVAISSNERLPTALNATFVGSALNPLIRLEPINSLDRVVQDRIGFTGYQALSPEQLAAEYRLESQSGAIIDISSATTLAANVRPFTLADVTLFVSTGRSLVTVDAFSGGVETRPGDNAYTNGSVGDIDMRTDGRLFLYYGQEGDTANNGVAYEVDTGNGQIGRANLLAYGDGISNDPEQPTFWQISGRSVDALAIGRTGVASYNNDSYFYSIREQAPGFLDAVVGDSILYRGRTASNNSAAFIQNVWTGRIGEIGSNIGGTQIIGNTTGMQFRNDQSDQELFGVSDTGRFYTINTGNADATVLANFASVPIPANQNDGIVGATLGGFQGLTAAPVNLEGGRYQGSFFAITSTGRLVCITDGDLVTAGFQPALMANVFDSNGDGYADSYVSNVMIGNPTGLAFSPLDVNLWHPTNRRGDLPGDPVGAPDPGHGVNAGFDNTRFGEVGGTSMYFGLENYADRNGGYISLGGPTQFGTAVSRPGVGHGYNWQEDLTANPAIGNNYNVAGGAYGSLITNPFSLSGYSYTDKPTLYFNYFLDTEDAASTSDGMRDSARVFISIDDGRTWEVLATNNQVRSDNGTENAELPNRLSASSAIGSASNQHVQELFDSTGTWRQARVDLGNWAGESNIRLRFDFSTAGEVAATDRSTSTPDAIKAVNGVVLAGETVVPVGSVEGLRVGMVVSTELDATSISGTAGGFTAVTPRIAPRTTIAAIDPVFNTVTLSTATGVSLANGDQLRFFRQTALAKNAIDGLANTTGNLGSAGRGANNAFEGFYVDDIMVGFAERGEMVTGAVAGQADVTFSLDTPVAGNYFEQVLEGAYQLEIRRGTEYAWQPSSGDSQAGIYQTFDTNDRLVRSTADTVRVLEQNSFATVDGVVVRSGGNGTVGPVAPLGNATVSSPVVESRIVQLTSVANVPVGATVTGGGLPTGIDVIAVNNFTNTATLSRPVTLLGGTVLNFAISGIQLTGTGVATSATEHNRLTWTVDLANQPSAFLEFQYRTNSSESLTPLPATFTINALNPNPFGDGVAVSVDGGTTWRTIANFTATRQPWRQVRLDLVDAFGGALTANTQIGFFQSGPQSDADTPDGRGGIVIRGVQYDPNTWLDVPVGGSRHVLITTAPRIATSGLVGDSNHVREQGQFIVENNIISDASQYGIRVDAANRAAGSNAPTPGVVRNLPTINADRLVPGAVINNNVILGSGSAGILFSGQTNSAGVPDAAVPFGRIFNNTIYGGATPAGTGVQVTDNAGPTLLNNIFANLATGVNVADAGSRAQSFVGYSAYYNTTQSVSGVTESNGIMLNANPFVNVAGRNFYLAAGSLAIDSSLDVLQDRDAFRVVKDAVGIPPSPILAPDYDLYGQLRLDDPGVAGGAPGLGLNVFKDRGAVERADLTQPTMSLIEPNAGGPEVDLTLGAAQGTGRFVLQLADVGAGIDDSTVSSDSFVIYYRPLVSDDRWSDEEMLEAGTDYVFTYLENTKTAVFEAPAVFDYGQYLIVVNNADGSRGTALGVTARVTVVNRQTAAITVGSAFGGVIANSAVTLNGVPQPNLRASVALTGALAFRDGNGNDVANPAFVNADGAVVAIAVDDVLGFVLPAPVDADRDGDLDSISVTTRSLVIDDAAWIAHRGLLTGAAVTINGVPAAGVTVANVLDGNTVELSSGVTITKDDEVGFLYATTPIRDRAGNDLLNNDHVGVGTTAFAIGLSDLPSAPEGLVATLDEDVNGNLSVTLTWDAADANGAAVVSYTISGTEDGNALDDVVVNSNSTTAMIPNLKLDSIYVFSVRASNSLGTGSLSSPVTFVAQALPTFALKNDTGRSTTDNYTNDPTVEVSDLAGTDVWQYTTNGTADVPTWVNGDPNTWDGATQTFTFDLPGDRVFAAGEIGVRRVVNGVPGGARLNTTPFTLDTVVADPTFTLASDTGFSATDKITRIPTVNVLGVEANARWRYSRDGGQTWSVDQTAASFPLLEGVYAVGDIIIEQTDLAGNRSGQASNLTLISIDTTLPNLLTWSLAEDSGVLDDFITRNGRIDVSRLEAGASWEYSTNGGVSWITGEGTSFTLPEGGYSQSAVRIRQTDIAGNVGDPALLRAITVDSRVATPVPFLFEDTGVSRTDRVTSNGRINVSGLESGAQWQYRTASGAAWQTLPGSIDLSEGVYPANSIQVRQTDTAGNQSGIGVISYAITVDRTAVTPTVGLAEDTGASNSDRNTRNGRINVGSLEVGSTWRYSVNGGQTWTAGTGTSFALPARATAYGSNTVKVQQTDRAGNVGELVVTHAITVDQTLPAKPGLTLSQDTGAPGDGITSDGRVNVSGVETGATWEWSRNSGLTWTTGAAASGGASSFVLPEGVYSRNAIRVRQKDLAGNVGAVGSYANAITVDASAATVMAVTSTLGNGMYGFSTTTQIPIRISFNEPVLVTGSPILALNTLPQVRYATYTSGSGTSTLTFTYTIAAGDSAADLGYRATNSLTGGTIVNRAGLSALRALPALGGTGSLDGSKNISIQTVISAIARVAGAELSKVATARTEMTSALQTIDIEFNTQVTGVNAAVANLRLYRNGRAVALAADSLKRLTGTVYRLSLPASLTVNSGDYFQLQIGGNSSTILSGPRTMTTLSAFHWQRA